MKCNPVTAPLAMRAMRMGVAAGLALLSSTLSGCAGPAPQHERWTYSWTGTTFNLSGCALDKRNWDSFLAAWLRVLRRKDGEILLFVHTSQPPTSVLMSVEAQRCEATGTWKSDTNDGTLRAWLIRMPKEVFDESFDRAVPFNPFQRPDIARMAALADRTSATDDKLVFPLSGKVSVSADQSRVTNVHIDLRTPGPVPVYQEYFRWTIRLGEEVAAEHFFSDSAHVAKVLRTRDAQHCLGSPAVAPATIRGAMTGRWEGTK